MTNSKMVKSRRQFLSTLAVGGSALMGATPARAQRRQRPVASRVRDAVLYVNEQAHFPFGFYFEHAGSLKAHQEGLQLMATLGCNTTYLSLGDDDKSLAELTSIYDRAQELGIGIVGESPLHPLDNDMLAVDALKDHPACLGWTIGDDIMDQQPSDLAKIASEVRRHDSNHIVYASSNGIQRQQRIRIEDFLYRGLDALAVQAYPVPSPRHWWDQEPGVKDLRLVYYRCRRLVQALEPMGMLPMCNPQAFTWWYESDDRYPTVAETDNMLYQALIAGVKGVLAYTLANCCREEEEQSARYFFDGQPELKAAWTRLASEVRTLSPYLLHGKCRTLTIDPSFDWVVAATWEYEGKTLIMATNCDEKPQPARVPLVGAPTAGEVRAVFADRPGDMRIADGFLGGTIGPLDVHVYEI
jgi:hypothetical protein